MNQQQIKNQNIYELKITREPVKSVKPIANDRLLMRFQRILFVREKGYAVINVNVFPASQWDSFRKERIIRCALYY